MEVDFRNTDTIQPNMGTWLPVGNHVVRIEDAKEDESKNGHFGFELQLTNDLGDMRDWRYISRSSESALAFTLGMVRQVAEACGAPCMELLEQVVEIPSQEWSFFVTSMKNKTVGVIVREEPGNDGKTRRKVQAYVDPAEFRSGGTNGVNGAIGGTAAVGTATDEEIPF